MNEKGQLLIRIVISIFFIFILSFGIAKGGFDYNEKISVPKCLSCLGLNPKPEIEFTFDTVGNEPHPDWVIDSLKERVVFIDFSQKVGCPACDDMLPVILELEEEYEPETDFYILYLDLEDSNMTMAEKGKWFNSYDFQGKRGAPTFIIITLNEDDNGEVRPYFGEIAGKVSKNKLRDVIDDALALHLTYKFEYN